jgi:hypothetical protein
MKRIISKIALVALVTTIGAPMQADTTDIGTKIKSIFALSMVTALTYGYANKSRIPVDKSNLTYERGAWIVGIAGLIALLDSVKK